MIMTTEQKQILLDLIDKEIQQLHDKNMVESFDIYYSNLMELYGSVNSNTSTELCPHCTVEVELEYKNEYQECPSCQKMIAPCAQHEHGENGNCICQKV